jgi:carbon monoxide dehydrogenase subunit G
MALSETMLIAAPPERVWMLIDDPAHLPRWMPDVIDVTYPDGRDAKRPVGTRFVQRVREASGEKRYEGRVTGFDSGRFLAVELTDALVRIAVSYKLEPHRIGTRLAYTGDLAMRNPLVQMMALAAWPLTRTILLRQIADLKRVAEAPEPAPARAAREPAKPPAKAARTPTASRSRKARK